MAKSTKKKSRSKSKAMAAEFEFTSMTKEHVGTAVTALVYLLIVVGLVIGSARLEARAAYMSPEPMLEFRWPLLAAAEGQAPVSWLGPEFQGYLMEVGLGALGTDTDSLSARDLKNVSEALAREGWFDGPPVVQRLAGGRLEVSGTWRTHAAVVRVGGRDHLVARGGELLPAVYDEGRSGLRVITGAQFDPPGKGDVLAYGAAWLGGDVQAAIDLMALLSTRPYWFQIVGVDASRYLSDNRLVIITDAGNRIVWGAGVDEWSPGEQSTEVKLQRLTMLYHEFTRIDANQSTIEIFGQDVLIDVSASGN